MTERSTPRAWRIPRTDLLALVGLLVSAAVLRFVDLPTRGTWDGDQGHDMLVLRTWMQSGVVPLLGPPTSIGDVHHGAWYYYLLTPPALLTGGQDPNAVVAWIALAGVAAVGVVWWLGRAIGGSLAGAVAGGLLAVSAAAIEGSTFIWNPNLIALSSAVALAGAWRAWTGGAGWWWVVAAIGVAVTMQAHVLGVALLPVILVPMAIDVRRRRLGAVAAAVAVVFLVAYLPLVIHELTTGFAETTAFLAYLRGDRAAEAAALPVRLLVVGLRVVSWPLVGLIADAVVPAVVVTTGVAVLAVWLARDRRLAGDARLDGDARLAGDARLDGDARLAGDARLDGDARLAGRWYGIGLAWTVVALAVAAPSLAVVVRALPNDHYHAFADPMVVLLVGVGVSAAVRLGGRGGRIAGAVVVLALVAWNVGHLPPAAHPDGGWPAARAAGDRVVATLRAAGIGPDDVVRLESLPDFKSTEAVAYPLVRAGLRVDAATPDGPAPGSRPAIEGPTAAFILLCDDLFREILGAACGGPAEDGAPGWTTRILLDRFEAHPGRWVSVYGPPAGAG